MPIADLALAALERFLIAGLLALVCLEIRSRGEHRLFGRTSRYWAAATTLATGAVGAAVGAVLAQTKSNHIAFVATLAIPGGLLASVFKRDLLEPDSQINNDAPNPMLKLITAGIAILVYKLEESFLNDQAEWYEARFPDGWLDRTPESVEIEQARRHFYGCLREPAIHHGRVDELNHLSTGISKFLRIEEESRRLETKRLHDRLRQGGLLNEGDYRQLIQEGNLEVLREHLRTDAMNLLNHMLLCGYRWGCRDLTPLTAAPSASSDKPPKLLNS